MPTWRYKFVWVNLIGNILRIDGKEVVEKVSFYKHADILGADGWELISTTTLSDSNGRPFIQYSFKRPD